VSERRRRELNRARAPKAREHRVRTDGARARGPRARSDRPTRSGRTAREGATKLPGLAAALRKRGRETAGGLASRARTSIARLGRGESGDTGDTGGRPRRRCRVLGLPRSCAQSGPKASPAPARGEIGRERFQPRTFRSTEGRYLVMTRSLHCAPREARSPATTEKSVRTERSFHGTFRSCVPSLPEGTFR
jgi:hypothetical protein